MKIKNKIITIVIAVVLTLITCIPIFGVNSNEQYLELPPDDLGTIYTGDYLTGYAKFYIKLDTTDRTNTLIKLRLSNSSSYTSLEFTIGITYNNNTLRITTNRTTQYYYSFYAVPEINIENINSQYYYIPVYIYNGNLYAPEKPNNCTYYLSSTTNPSVIAQEAYNTGYTNGYNSGFNEALENGIEHYTNITGYVTQLLTQFVGSDAAQYITPIAIVLVILFVYFVFIRFLLSLIKAKGVIKTCDIVMVVACILLLIVMYAPMLNITINKIIRTDTIETTESTIVRRTDYIYDEYGRIISGPAGTINYEEFESTTSEQEQTEVEVTTQTLEKEITTYEETKDNNISY